MPCIIVFVCWGLNLYFAYVIITFYFDFIVELTAWQKLKDYV